MKAGRYLLPAAAALTLAALYLPIASLILYSFNSSKLVTVWGGFSFKWYGKLLTDGQILSALAASIRIAFCSATAAVILGTLAALALVRYLRPFWRRIMAGMITTPLVMPDVIIGMSLLLLFVSMEAMIGWPAGRGMVTVFLAHATFCMAYTTVVIGSRLVSIDSSLEEAALDLGARPWRVFVDVTIPAIAPALVAAWLLAFTLSLDDLVIASFVNGPASSTLPIVVFSKVRLGVSPDINALATILILIVGIGVAAAGWIHSRQRR